MTEQEKINTEMQMNLALTDAKFSMFVDEMRSFKQEMISFKQEMRDYNANLEARRAEDMREIRTSIASMGRHMHNFLIAGIVGVGAIAVTAIGAIASIVLK